jgi:hypothetical protein
MRAPNTTLDVYVGANAPPSVPDTAAAMGYLGPNFVGGEVANGNPAARTFLWDTILEVPLDTDIRDDYPTVPTQRIFVPHTTTPGDGQEYRVVFVERVLPTHSPRGAVYKRVYLRRWAQRDPDMAITVREVDGSPSYATVNVIEFDQADGFALSEPTPGVIRINFSLPGGVYTDERAQDAIGTILTDTDTIDFTYDDPTPKITADVRKQMSLTSDASGLKLVGDSASPGNSKLYGTDGSGNKGWYNQPAGGGGGIGAALFSQDATNVSSIDATGLTGYAWYHLQAWNLRSNGGAMPSLYLYTSSNNGSTFDNGASDYVYTGGFGNDSKIQLLGSFPGNGNTESGASLSLWFPGLGGTTICKLLHGFVTTMNGMSGASITAFAAIRQSTSKIDAIRLIGSNGNLDGSVRVYGYN